MNTAPRVPASNPARWMVWTGRFLSALPVLMMTVSAVIKFAHPPSFMEQWTHHAGYLESSLFAIAIAEITSALLYVIPQTAVLGAILMTGYLGGAVATHVRIGESAFIGPLLLGMLVWAGLYLRDERIRQLIPLRQAKS